MKRKLVSYEVFEQMKDASLSTVVSELVEAQDHLARTLGCGPMVMESFDDTSVIYRRNDGTFLKANYLVEDEAVSFSDMEEIVVDEASEDNKRRDIVRKMLEAILEKREGDAKVLLEKFMDFALEKRARNGRVSDANLDEAHVRIYGTRGKNGPKVSVRQGAKDPKRSAAAKKAHRLHQSAYALGGKKRHGQVSQERNRRKGYARAYGRLNAISGGKQYKKKHLDEWLTLANNVFEYADIMENSHILSESLVRHDAQGEVTSVKLPSSRVRNEGKIIKQQYAGMLKQDSPKVMREAGLRVGRNPAFAKAVSEAKRNNSLSDNAALEDTLGSLVKNFPTVLYITQEELAKQVGTALEEAGVRNFGDETCSFIAEGILRTAHGVYAERVDKLLKAANIKLGESEDPFTAFQAAIKGYFEQLDEAIQTESRVFEDLYNAVLDVRKLALESQNEDVRDEANEIVSTLEEVLSGKAARTIEMAVDVADWLNGIAEANIPGASNTWSVVKTPHDTVTGDHPQMHANAKVDGYASKYNGDWDDPAPMISGDKKGYAKSNSEEARNRAWGNKGGNKVWPDLNNPNVPEPMEFTMKGQKGADKDGTDDFSRFTSSDTFPSLKNPYTPKALIPKQKVDPGNSVE